MRSTSEKASLSSSFHVSHSLFVLVRRNYAVNLAFKMTGVEGTHLTLAVIPFQVGENNSLICLAIANIQEKLAEFLIL